MTTFTHVIQLPPLTDTQEIIGTYKTVFETIGVNCEVLANYNTPTNTINHPIVESQKILEEEFLSTYQLISTSHLMHGGLTLVNMSFTSCTCVFIFSYSD